MNRFCIYHDALRLARQHGDEAAIRSLQREIRRLRNNELISEITALGPAKAIRRISLVAQEPTYSGVFARRVLRRLQSAAFETVNSDSLMWEKTYAVASGEINIL